MPTDSFCVVFTADGAIYSLRNGNVIRYKRVNGIYYRVETAPSVINALETARSSGERLRVFYGDVVTGRDWLEECDVIGYVRNSIGPLKVPLLIHNRRSVGGPAIVDHCIVRIKHAGWSGPVVYQHQAYNTGLVAIRPISSDDPANARLLVQGYTHALDVDGRKHANFRSEEAARRFLKKMID